MSQMAAKRPALAPQATQAPLESGANGAEGLCHCPGDAIAAQAWPLQQSAEARLLDMFLLSSKSNLVNAANPWGKCTSADPNDKEALSSCWRSKMHNELTADPGTQLAHSSSHCVMLRWQGWVLSTSP